MKVTGPVDIRRYNFFFAPVFPLWQGLFFFMISHKQVGTTDHKAAPGGYGRIRNGKGKGIWGQLIFQRLRRLYGIGKAMERTDQRRKEQGHKRQMATGPDLHHGPEILGAGSFKLGTNLLRLAAVGLNLPHLKRRRKLFAGE
ncbi:hypothetical protein EDB82DRAFT_472009 [Fusarium venenatum]|uniref:uncharacterized protein n=1 Tax=Fusarium venenatum TaxID=56646 RepID=UPI001D72A9C0|nr:hypothetical protein EDB82DRAFT_472009 [Fusarium venenatum]